MPHKSKASYATKKKMPSYGKKGHTYGKGSMKKKKTSMKGKY